MATKISIGDFVLMEDQDRIVIRESFGAHVAGWIVPGLFGPGILWSLVLMILADIDEPGQLGKGLAKKLGVQAGPVLAEICSIIIMVIAGVIGIGFCVLLYFKLTHGRFTWILDRNEDAVFSGSKVIRPLSRIRHVAVTQQVLTGFYEVRFAPHIPAWIATRGFDELPLDPFSFVNKTAAVEFAQKIAMFLGVSSDVA